ncbi:sigma-54-dependent Fis family transcriptional regulator [Evansella sp. LMS18]|uniref:sigma-54 interaction domain-containing protein n=1 Tax=Evansella sp. LMS18 TaxID=2924033 RepID=UPI0026F34D10|nr:sigma 54-interacting transcriptional regulator [Evansella sp. LMS18]
MRDLTDDLIFLEEDELPAKVTVYDTEKSAEGTPGYPYNCSFFQEAAKTGYMCSVDITENNHPCEFCSENKGCKKGRILFYPVPFRNKIEKIVSLFVKRENLTEFESRRGMIEVLVNNIETSLISQMEKQESRDELNALKKEMSSLLELTTDSVLLIYKDGRIADFSQNLVKQFSTLNAHLIGRSVNSFITKRSWEVIQKTQEETTLILELNEEVRNYNNLIWKAIVRPVYNNKEIQSYLLKITGIREEKEVTMVQQLYSFNDIKGVSESIRSVKETAKRISEGNMTILLRGESGTGKEVFAQAIHGASHRSQAKFIAINCAAIPESLLESELFGYESGAFTGAQKKGKAGRFELANGGTLFLDEIGDMSLQLQAKLLRILQERKLERVGGTKSISVDVRIIAATHRNLEKMVADNKFREDLYYRLNVIPLTIPPLRNRKEDIPLLVDSFMKSISSSQNIQPKHLTEEALHALLNYRWPGNIRELRNVVEHFAHLEIGDLVTLHSLPDSLREYNKTVDKQADQLPLEQPILTKVYKEKDAYKNQIMSLLDTYGRHTDGKKIVAKKLGISLPTLYRKLKRYKIL